MARFDIPTREVKVMRELAELSDTNFSALLSGFQKIEPEIKALDFIPLLAKEVPTIDDAVLKRFTGTISNLSRIIEGRQLSAEEVAENVRETIDFERPVAFNENKDGIPEKSKVLRDRLVKLLTLSRFISVVFKAGSVFTD